MIIYTVIFNHSNGEVIYVKSFVNPCRAAKEAIDFFKENFPDETSEAEIDEIVSQLKTDGFSILRSGPTNRLKVWRTEFSNEN
jgi:hypothetical protein